MFDDLPLQYTGPQSQVIARSTKAVLTVRLVHFEKKVTAHRSILSSNSVVDLIGQSDGEPNYLLRYHVKTLTSVV